MRNLDLAHDYLKRAGVRLGALEVLYAGECWADVVRESQEVVELAFDGAEDLTPGEFYARTDADRALAYARRVVELVGRHLRDVAWAWAIGSGAYEAPSRAPTAAMSGAHEAGLGPHAHPAAEAVLFEEDLQALIDGEAVYQVDAELPAWVVDRLTTDADWSRVVGPPAGPARIVFYSIKGGVGRSAALAVAAWHLAARGERVLVVDLDLESPGLSTALLPEDRRPRFGVTDWLVEDLVGNGDVVRRDMVAASELSRDGAIFVVPTHGAKPGAYVAKLGRAWMPVMT